METHRGVVFITTAQLQSTKPKLRFCAGSYSFRSVSEIRDGKDLWQWSLLEIRLNVFRRSTIPQNNSWWLMIRSHKLKSHMYFCSRDHVKSRDKYKTFYFNFCDAMSTKLEMILVYEKGSSPIIMTWHNSCMTSKKSYSLFSHGPWPANSTRWSMTTKLDKVIGYWATMVLDHHAQNCIILWSRDYL